MAFWDILKNTVKSIVKVNGSGEITGTNLQSTLLNIINNVGKNATFVGTATPSTNPGSPDGPVFYIATTTGTYSNFDGAVLATNTFGILTNLSGSWELISIPNTSGILVRAGSNGGFKVNAGSNIVSAQDFYTFITGQSNKASNTSKASFASGYNNTLNATNNSHAEGSTNIIDSANNTHAEGYNNKVLAGAHISHVEGTANTIEGYTSHAEGANNTIIAPYAHAEGKNNTVGGVQEDGSIKGSASHAEGYNNTITGDNAHVEGREVEASANNSHAEGYLTKAQGINSHAEGREVEASANNSHAEGYETYARGTNSHAEGHGTDAGAEASHTEGTYTTANGRYSHAEGVNTVAESEASHAEGYGASAGGEASHAEGYGASASGSYSHAEGNYTESSGYSSHVEGEYSTANGEGSHAEGAYSTANGLGSHAEGCGTLAQNDYEHACGRFNAPTTNSIFSIGIGYEDERKNAIIVDNTGRVSVLGVNGYQGAGEEPPAIQDFANIGIEYRNMSNDIPRQASIVLTNCEPIVDNPYIKPVLFYSGKYTRRYNTDRGGYLREKYGWIVLKRCNSSRPFQMKEYADLQQLGTNSYTLRNNYFDDILSPNQFIEAIELNNHFRSEKYLIRLVEGEVIPPILLWGCQKMPFVSSKSEVGNITKKPVVLYFRILFVDIRSYNITNMMYPNKSQIRSTPADFKLTINNYNNSDEAYGDFSNYNYVLSPILPTNI